MFVQISYNTLAHVRASVGQPAKTYLHQLCTNTGCNLEDLQGAVDDRDGWHEREPGNFMLSA